MAENNKTEKEQYTIRLRALRSEDYEVLWEWRNRPEVRKMYSGHPFYVNPEKEKLWLQKVLTSDYPLVVMGIEIAEKEQLIGITSLKDINYIHRSAEYAIFMIDKVYENRWYLLHAYFQTLSFAFNDMGLNRLWAKIYEYNKKAQSLIKYGGFIEEGVLRQSIYKDGKYINEVLLSILREEWDQLERKESYLRQSKDSSEKSSTYIKF
jgi:RimJ/RimL family protein N-acetyltransferase